VGFWGGVFWGFGGGCGFVFFFFFFFFFSVGGFGFGVFGGGFGGRELDSAIATRCRVLTFFLPPALSHDRED